MKSLVHALITLVLFWGLAVRCAPIDADDDAASADVGGNPGAEERSSASPTEAEDSNNAEQLDGVKTVDEALAILRAVKEVLAAEYPLFLDHLPKTSDTDLVNAFLRAMHPDLVFSPSKTGAAGGNLSAKRDKPGSENAAERSPRAVTIASNQICYVRLGTLNASDTDELAKNLRMIANLASPPRGVILDVRNCDEMDPTGLPGFFGLFSVKRFENHTDLDAATKSLVKRPTLLLVGGKTSGAGELFAKELRREKRCLVMGEDTAGDPFERTRVSVAGGVLEFPRPTAAHASISLSPLNPDVVIPAYPQLPFGDVASDPAAMTRDECLTRAIDLLISLEALKKRNRDGRGNAGPSGEVE